MTAVIAAGPQLLLSEAQLRTPVRAELGHAPLSAYLSRLGSAQSRRVMRSSLDTIARAVSQGACDAASFPWYLLRYPHTAAIRAWLAERAAPATANRIPGPGPDAVYLSQASINTRTPLASVSRPR